MQEDNNIVQPDPEYIAYQEAQRQQQTAKKRNKTILWVVLAVVLVAIIVVVVLFVINNTNNSESSLTDRLEKYATDMYNNDIKDIRNEKYITIDLNYMERYNFDVSSFDDKQCDRLFTYAVVVVDDNKKIEDVITTLDCEAYKE